MPQQQKQCKKPIGDKFRCDVVEGERFHAQTEEVFRYNWWEVFCFPYILCARFWDCFVSLCAGTNQCMVYWMVIQWVVCKITRITTPNAIIFPYYFYVFCQVFLLTAFFIMLWVLLGKSLFIPYFKAYYEAMMDIEPTGPTTNKTNRLAFRKYCFRKGEIFDSTLDDVNSYAEVLQPRMSPVFAVITDILLRQVFH